MSECSRVNKRPDSSLSFLCEVIMHSPRCFCSHANEVDRVGNHFQTLSRGRKQQRLEKQRLEQKNALLLSLRAVEKWSWNIEQGVPCV